METQNQPATGKGRVIKSIYFYLVSFVALMMVVWSVADMINLGLKTWVFTKADNYSYGRIPCATNVATYGEPGHEVTESSVTEEQIKNCEKQEEINQKNEEQNRIAQRQMNVVRDISMIVVGIPLFWIHWRIVRNKEENL